MTTNSTTEQVDPKGSPHPTHPNGSLPNPTGKGGFGDHPENRNPGGWNKEHSISYQYNKMLRMDENEWAAFKIKMKDGETTMAERIAYQRIEDAIKDLATTKEITDRTEGKAPQNIDLTTKGEGLNPFKQLDAEDLRKLAQEG